MAPESAINAEEAAPGIGTLRYQEGVPGSVPQNLAGLSFRRGLVGKRLISSWRVLWPQSEGKPTAIPVGTLAPAPAPTMSILRYQPELYASNGNIQEYRAQRQRQELVGRAALGILALALAIPIGVLTFSHKHPQTTRPIVTAPQQAIPVVPSKVAPPTTHYVIKAGDTLSEIAHQHHVHLKDLLAVNRLSETAALQIGRSLILPGTSNPAAPAGPVLGKGQTIVAQAKPAVHGPSHPKAPIAAAPSTMAKGTHPRIYIVRPGQHDPALIAHLFGLASNTVLAANHLQPGAKVKTGRRLTLPPADGYYHTVQRGDTIGKLLERRHIDRSLFAKYNPGITKLHPHQVVFLPGDPPALDSSPAFLPRGYRARDHRHRSHRGILGDLGRALAEVFHWPMASHHISSPFGDRGRDFHPGVDIPARIGTPIHVARDGVVVHAGWEAGYGECVDVNHGGGVMTRYAHASKILVHDGERVEAGQEIALVGETGNATGPHLHFEVRVNGRPVNPMKVF